MPSRNNLSSREDAILGSERDGEGTRRAPSPHFLILIPILIWNALVRHNPDLFRTNHHLEGWLCALKMAVGAHHLNVSKMFRGAKNRKGINSCTYAVIASRAAPDTTKKHFRIYDRLKTIALTIAAEP